MPLNTNMNSLGGGDKGNDGLYEVVSKWLDDSNFSQLVGLTEPNIIEVENIEVNIGVDEINNIDDDEDGDDDDYHVSNDDEKDNHEEFRDSDCEIYDDDELFENNVDLSVEFTDKGKEKIVGNTTIDDNYIDSSDDKSIQNSNEDDSTKWPVFNSRKESGSINLELGMLFGSKEEFKENIKNWSIATGKTIKFLKNDKRRCKVICRKSNCPFSVYISKHEGSESWQIRSLQEHTCSWSYHNKTLTSTMIAKKFVRKVRNNPQCKLKLFRREVIDELKLHVSMSQARRAICMARKVMHMKEDEQFNKLWDYCVEIARTNVGTTISVQTTSDPDLEGRKRFNRMYVCFEACKKGFLVGCRPIVGVDGCFLKGPQGGQLLTAVSLDGNNNIFPVAWAVVESESRSSWEWFLNLLAGDLHILDNQHRFTFISDKQKGLLPAFENVLPEVTNRFCVRHLHENFKLAGFKGVALKNAVWAVARSTTINQFKYNMEELAKIDENAFKWLNEKQPGDWSRAYFNCIPKCDTLLNNMCESFNSLILEQRELSIIPMFESIRTLVMTRMQERKEASMHWTGKLCPRTKDALGKSLYEAGNCIGVKADDDNYQITTMQGAQYTVDLGGRVCSCRKWELTGLPCVHVCAAVNMSELDHESFVHEYYSVDTYRRTYQINIMPVNGPEEWPKSDKVPPLPPKYSKPKRGRPPKLRRRAPDEQRNVSQRRSLSRSIVTLHCSKCKQSGHNSRRCGKKAGKLVEIPMHQTTQPEVDLQPSTERSTLSSVFDQPTLEVCTQGSSNKRVLDQGVQ